MGSSGTSSRGASHSRGTSNSRRSGVALAWYSRTATRKVSFVPGVYSCCRTSAPLEGENSESDQRTKSPSSFRAIILDHVVIPARLTVVVDTPAARFVIAEARCVPWTNCNSSRSGECVLIKHPDSFSRSSSPHSGNQSVAETLPPSRPPPRSGWRSSRSLPRQPKRSIMTALTMPQRRSCRCRVFNFTPCPLGISVLGAWMTRIDPVLRSRFDDCECKTSTRHGEEPHAIRAALAQLGRRTAGPAQNCSPMVASTPISTPPTCVELSRRKGEAPGLDRDRARSRS